MINLLIWYLLVGLIFNYSSVFSIKEKGFHLHIDGENIHNIILWLPNFIKKILKWLADD